MQKRERVFPKESREQVGQTVRFEKARKEIDRRGPHAFKQPEEERQLPGETRFPNIKRGYGDTVTSAKLRNRRLFPKVRKKDGDDETEAVRTSRNEYVGQQGMGLAARSADKAGNDDHLVPRPSVFKRDKIPLVSALRREHCRAAVRAAPEIGPKYSQSGVKEFNIRKKIQICLAKCREKSYHLS